MRPVYTLSLLVLIGIALGGCAADSTLRGAWGTWQMKGSSASPCAAPIGPAPETRTPSSRKGTVEAPSRPVAAPQPAGDAEPVSAAPTPPAPPSAVLNGIAWPPTDAGRGLACAEPACED